MPPLDFDIDRKQAAIRMMVDRILVLAAFSSVYVIVAFFIGTYSLSEILVNAAIILGVGTFTAVCISLPAVNNAILSIHNGEAATRSSKVNCDDLRVIPLSRGAFGIWLKDRAGRRYYFPGLW